MFLKIMTFINFSLYAVTRVRTILLSWHNFNNEMQKQSKHHAFLMQATLQRPVCVLHGPHWHGGCLQRHHCGKLRGGSQSSDTYVLIFYFHHLSSSLKRFSMIWGVPWTRLPTCEGKTSTNQQTIIYVPPTGDLRLSTAPNCTTTLQMVLE